MVTSNPLFYLTQVNNINTIPNAKEIYKSKY